MRLLKGLGALLVLAVLVIGIPAALTALGGNPLPGDLSWSAVQTALLRRDDGTVLIGVITLVGWLAWFVVAVSLLVELVQVLSGSRIHIELPGLAGPQRLASALLVAVVAMLTLPVPSVQAEPVTPPSITQPRVPAIKTPAPVAEQPGLTHGSGSRRLDQAEATSATASPTVHEVQRGDDLWSLAERYYGQGRDWRKIAAANPDVLSGGPDRLQPGWRLRIPGVERLEPSSEGRTVTVRPGDSLAGIADRIYGEQDRWRDIFEANRARIADPDQIEIGERLRLPDSTAGHVSGPGPGPGPGTKSPQKAEHEGAKDEGAKGASPKGDDARGPGARSESPKSEGAEDTGRQDAGSSDDGAERKGTQGDRPRGGVAGDSSTEKGPGQPPASGSPRAEPTSGPATTTSPGRDDAEPPAAGPTRPGAQVPGADSTPTGAGESAVGQLAIRSGHDGSSAVGLRAVGGVGRRLDRGPAGCRDHRWARRAQTGAAPSPAPWVVGSPTRHSRRSRSEPPWVTDSSH